MQPLTKNLSRWKNNFPVVSVVFFALFYLFLWLCIEPQLVYLHFEVTRKSPFFKSGWLFLQDCLSYPGGPARYLAAFLTQLCYFSWLGTLCITLIAWGIYRLTASLTTIAADSPWRVICYVPALLMLMICGRYENPLSTGVAVLVVVSFSVLYKKFSPRLGPVRANLFLIVPGILYYIAGSAALVFIALAALCELFDRGKVLFCVLCIFLGLAACWLLGTYVFELEANEVYLYSSPFNPVRQNLEREKWARLFEEVLFGFLIVAVLLINVNRKLVATWAASRQPRPGQSLPEKSSVTRGASNHFYRGGFKWVVQVALLVLVAVPSVFFSFDRESKKGIRVSYFACRRMWLQVLDAAQKVSLKRYFFFCNHVVNRALYHTGRLGDEMFACPQGRRDTDLVLRPVQGGNILYNMERVETCLELGLVNVAEKLAYEFLEGADDSPLILEQLALINIVKGQIESACVFLKALSKNLIYGKGAKDLLRRLESDPQLESDQRVRHLRSIMMTTDYTSPAYNLGYWLEELLRGNKHNKMAFEYLMAHYLLTGQLDKLVENLPRLDDFSYKSIPRHYQEAILIYEGITQNKIDLGDRQISAETSRQYEELDSLVKQFSDNMKLLWQVSAPSFGRTYFFYYIFGISGVLQ